MSQNPETPKLSKAESARLNGAKSHGAATPEGKLKAANGNLKHGAYSSRVLMDGESPEAYAILKNCFYGVFQPQDPFECECVTTLADTRWRIRRIESTESAMLNDALLLQKEKIAESFDAIDPRHQRAFAVDARIHSIDSYTRVEERLHRTYERTHRLLAKHRRNRGLSMPSIEDQGPGPAPMPPPAPHSTPETSDLTSPPNSPSASHPAIPSVIAKVAIILVIFAWLLLSPESGTAGKLNSALQSALRSLQLGSAASYIPK